MAISVEKWSIIEENLNSLYRSVDFLLDGHKLHIQWARKSEKLQSYVLIVYIDWFIKVGSGYPCHGFYDSFTEKVWRKRTNTISLFGKRDLSGKSKREIASINRLKKQYPDKVQTWNDCYFCSARSLIRQYKKLEGLELVEKEENNG